MLKFFLICCAIVVFIALFCYVTRNYVNPYKLIFVFGKKGSGKSTLLTKLAVRYSKKKWTVYTTENIPGTHNITDPKQIYKMDFPERSCILIDEVSLIWDNRDFKSMDKRVVEWFRYQRHDQRPGTGYLKTDCRRCGRDSLFCGWNEKCIRWY